MKLDGKVALITGAGTGIGAAIAERFVADGAKICITGRRQEMLDKVARSLPAGTVVTCAGDVTDFEDVKRMVETALGFTGRLDALMTFTHQPLQSQTFIVNVQTRQALGIRTIMREGDVGREPRAAHEFSPGVLGDPTIPPTGRRPAPTRDLIGLRGLYDYGPEQCVEHISALFFYNWDQMRSTGKFFAIGEDGAIAHTPAGAFIQKLSVAFYPPDMQPI